jgi:uncharacterized membrane protein
MGIVIAAIAAIVIAFLLPLLSFVRGFQLQAELNNLRSRIDLLERQLAARPVAPPRAEAVSPSPRADVAAPADAARPIQQPTSPPAPISPPLQRPAAPDAEPQRDLLHSLITDAAALALEERIGGRWLQHAGMIVLVLGIAFFLRYAFDHEWLSPVVRIVLGTFVGVGMAAGGLRLSRKYRAYGLLLSGGGIAVLYLSVYAGLNLYYLFEPALAFSLLVVITAAAAVLADRTDSLGLALMAVCGGFATPFLVGGTRDQQITLFTYVSLLVAATMYLAYRRTWPWLNVASLVLTGVTVLAWADRFYTPDKYLRTELFLTVYCAMFIDILRKAWHSSRQDTRLVFLLLLAPAGYHVWSVVTLSSHGLAFLIYVITFTLLTVLAGVQYGSSLLRAIAWLAVAAPLGSWIEAYHWRGWVAATLVTVVAVYGVHLAAQIRGVHAGEELEERDIALLHANSIGVFAALFQVLTDSVTIAQLAILAVVLAAGNVGIWAALRRASPIGALHWLGVAMTLVAIAIWIQFGGPWAVATWATEGAVVFWIATRARREWLRVGAWVLLGLAIYRWLQPDVQATTTSYVVLANARALTGIYLVGLLYVAAWLQHREPDAAKERRRHERATLLVAASIITLFVISTEITSFWAVRTAAPDAYVAREMMLSAAWVVYAALLVVIGMQRQYAPIRYFAIALFGVTLVKVFLVDLGTLGGIYRVAGFLVVGLILLIVSFLYQRASTLAPPKPSE